jgi:uncharacterized protein YPO0396
MNTKFEIKIRWNVRSSSYLRGWENESVIICYFKTSINYILIAVNLFFIKDSDSLSYQNI